MDYIAILKAGALVTMPSDKRKISHPTVTVTSKTAQEWLSNSAS